jgi:quercetin dioxygenase-like cupin family protein
MDIQFARDSSLTMRSHLSRRTAICGGAAALAAALVARGHTTAQDATPAAEEIVVEALGAGLPGGTPGRQLSLARMIFPPGFILPEHTHPGPVVAHVESGTFGSTALAGEARTVTRGANPDTPESWPVDTEVLLAAGDSLFHDEDWMGIDRAVGDEPCVLLLAVLFDPTQPLAHLMEGTPTP